MDPTDPFVARAIRLEGTSRWVVGSHQGFRELLKVLDEPSVFPQGSVLDSSLHLAVRFGTINPRTNEEESGTGLLWTFSRREKFC
jgi:hypothetical protein